MTLLHGYWAEATAEGPVSGGAESARVVLGTHGSPFIRPSLLWVAAQALRIADGLDPHPRTPWAPAGALRPVPASVSDQLGDVPTRLRAWAGSNKERRAAYAQVRAGDPYALIVSDHSGVYALALWPVTIRHDVPTASRIGRARHRKRRLRIPPLSRQTRPPAHLSSSL